MVLHGTANNEQPAIVVKRNKSTTKQVINRWCKQKSVVTVKAFFVGRAISPGFAVTRDEVLGTVDMSDSIPLFNLRDMWLSLA